MKKMRERERGGGGGGGVGGEEEEEEHDDNTNKNTQYEIRAYLRWVCGTCSLCRREELRMEGQSPGQLHPRG